MKEEVNSVVPVENRRLAAIMFTDMVGFSRQMGEDEARMLRLLDMHNQTIQQAVMEYHGTVIKTVGDAFLVDFPSVVHAVQCAQQIQNQFRLYSAEKTKNEPIHVRIGIHSGDIVQREGDVFGDGVNIAARLQALAAPDTICISDVVYRDVAKKLDLGTVVSLGKPQLKNIAERFTVYALLSEFPKGLRQTLGVQWLKVGRRVRPVHWGVVVGLLLIASTLVTVRYFPVLLPSTQSLPLPDKPSIVVLPFANMSNDPEQEYFSDGITEDITTGLAKISSPFVIARNSAFTYKGKAVKVQDVSREMGVQYVLEGSVRKTDDQIRVTAQLIDGLIGSHLWAERFDRPLKDIFAVQDEIVQKIVTTLNLQLTVMEQGFLNVRKRIDSLEAYDYFLRGTTLLNRFTKETNVQARQMFEKAIELDPQYAQAYSSLSATYYWEWFLQWSQTPPQAAEQALNLAQKAVALDDSLPQVHSLLGVLYQWVKRQHDQAIAEAERGVVLDPNNATGHFILGDVLGFAGRPVEGIELVKKAMRLNPRYPASFANTLGWSYLLTGRHEEAIAALKDATARNPNFLPAHANLAVTYSELGREAEAQAEVTEVLKLSSNASLEVWRRMVPFKDPAIVECLAAGLRRAGLK